MLLGAYFASCLRPLAVALCQHADGLVGSIVAHQDIDRATVLLFDEPNEERVTIHLLSHFRLLAMAQHSKHHQILYGPYDVLERFVPVCSNTCCQPTVGGANARFKSIILWKGKGHKGLANPVSKCCNGHRLEQRQARCAGLAVAAHDNPKNLLSHERFICPQR